MDARLFSKQLDEVRFLDEMLDPSPVGVMDCITVYGTVGRGSIPRWGTLINRSKIRPSGGTVYTRLSKSRAHVD